VRTYEPTPSAAAERKLASEPLKANMRAGCGKSRLMAVSLPVMGRTMSVTH
jgi:hypothetical protein